jgi:hypothetical protein
MSFLGHTEVFLAAAKFLLCAVRDAKKRHCEKYGFLDACVFGTSWSFIKP